MVGILISFWGDLFSGVMLVLGSVNFFSPGDQDGNSRCDCALLRVLDLKIESWILSNSSGGPNGYYYIYILYDM